jgi:hypothetical protein
VVGYSSVEVSADLEEVPSISPEHSTSKTESSRCFGSEATLNTPLNPLRR